VSGRVLLVLCWLLLLVPTGFALPLCLCPASCGPPVERCCDGSPLGAHESEQAVPTEAPGCCAGACTLELADNSEPLLNPTQPRTDELAAMLPIALAGIIPPSRARRSLTLRRPVPRPPPRSRRSRVMLL